MPTRDPATILGIVTARGGSKGVPRKNITSLGGKPLLAYTVEAALGSARLTRTLLSTDDEEIAAVGRDCGLEVPFMRPAELARDDTPTLPVIQHAIRWYEEHVAAIDAVCILQPTSPLRTSADIDACLDLYLAQRPDSVISVVPVPAKYNPHWVYFQNEQGLLQLSTGESEPIPRRQALPTAYIRSGSVYVTRRDVVMLENSLFGKSTLGYIEDPQRVVNIDSPHDLDEARQRLE